MKNYRPKVLVIDRLLSFDYMLCVLVTFSIITSSTFILIDSIVTRVNISWI